MLETLLICYLVKLISFWFIDIHGIWSIWFLIILFIASDFHNDWVIHARRLLVYILSVCCHWYILKITILNYFFDILDIIILFNDFIINEINIVCHINHFSLNKSINMEDLMFNCFLQFMKILLHIIELIQFSLEQTVSNIHISFINDFYHSMLSIYSWFTGLH